MSAPASPSRGVSFFLVLLEAAEGGRASAGVRLCLTKFWGKTLFYVKFRVAV